MGLSKARSDTCDTTFSLKRFFLLISVAVLLYFVEAEDTSDTQHH